VSGRIYQPFSWKIRVYWEDTDAGGVVYHARYAYFLERARSEWLRALGVEQGTLRERDDLVFAVRAMRLDFLRPARLDDLLECSARVTHLGGASLRFEQAIARGEELLLSAEVRVACLTATGFRPRPLPDWLLALA
jgi:acyl-CoA thioester hydrolase